MTLQSTKEHPNGDRKEQQEPADENHLQQHMTHHFPQSTFSVSKPQMLDLHVEAIVHPCCTLSSSELRSEIQKFLFQEIEKEELSKNPAAAAAAAAAAAPNSPSTVSYF